MSLLINKGVPNTCIFTLKEDTTIVDAKYILQIVSKATRKEKLMWLINDVSVNTERFNSFIIDEVDEADEDLTQMAINLDSGEYTFFVWQTDSTVLSLEQADDIIESGLLVVMGEGTVRNTFNVAPTKKIFV